MKTVILYTTRYGATQRCAQALAGLLEGEAELFNIARESRKVDLSQYGRVICGGSVYMGKIDPALFQYCIHMERELLTKQVGLFTCCLSRDEAAQSQFETAFPAPLREHAAAKACFGTVVDPQKLRFFDKLVIKLVSKRMPVEEIRQPDGTLSTFDTQELERFACALDEQSEPAAQPAELSDKE